MTHARAHECQEGKMRIVTVYTNVGEKIFAVDKLPGGTYGAENTIRNYGSEYNIKVKIDRKHHLTAPHGAQLIADHHEILKFIESH